MNVRYLAIIPLLFLCSPASAAPSDADLDQAADLCIQSARVWDQRAVAYVYPPGMEGCAAVLKADGESYSKRLAADRALFAAKQAAADRRAAGFVQQVAREVGR